MKILLITPPMTQVNTPYPSTAYLSAYLSEKGYEVAQKDLGLELFLKLFSKEGLAKIKREILKNSKHQNESVQFFLEAFEQYEHTIDPTIQFLKGKDPSLALRIANRRLLPEGPRFLQSHSHPEILDSFGSMGLQDKAKYFASLYLDDLADVIKFGVDSKFEFSRYGESLAASQTSFTPLYNELHNPDSLIEKELNQIILTYLNDTTPDVVGITVPFPGNMLGALKTAKYIKNQNKKIKTIFGGGYVNTELRELSDARFFEYVDFLCFDDGERPLECILEHLQNKRTLHQLLRTWICQDKQIVKISDPSEKDPAFKSLTAPNFSDLPLKNYVSMLEMPNPMHRMWSDFRWNKMILAHGCYWKKCTFCDTSLDYINRFEPAKVENLVDQIKHVVKTTNTTGFHFVDEAAPPALLKSLSQKLIENNIQINWWGNLRFDSQYTAEVAELMANAGCVAVTGGLEVASPRLLNLINKGITLEQVAQVTKDFANSGIYVHAYLMYGFPTQTVQETIDSLEVVRQLFENGCLHSAHWHRFLATAHSPVGKNPEQFGIKLHPPAIPTEGLFAKNEIPFTDSTGTDHDSLGLGLRKALYNYMHGSGIETDVRNWFDMNVPKTKLNSNYILQALSKT